MPNLPPRKRMRRREAPGGARFVTFSCYRRLPHLLQAGVRESLVERLALARERDGLRLHAFVLMPEHVHLVCTPDAAVPLQRTLRSIKMSIAKRFGESLARKPNDAERDHAQPYWQRGGGFDRNVRSAEELGKEIRYVHFNPVARGLVGVPTEWPWSSVHWWRGQTPVMCPCDYPQIGGVDWTQWLGFM